MRLGLLKEEGSEGKSKRKYNRKTSGQIELPFSLSSACEYSEVIFGSPFCSRVRLVVLAQPIQVKIDTVAYKHAT